MTDNKKPTPAAPSTEVASAFDPDILAAATEAASKMPPEIARRPLSPTLSAPASDVPPIASSGEDLRSIAKFLSDYFAPWGSWKTAWWEGEVSGDLAFSDANALKHVQGLISAALSTPPAASSGQDLREALAIGERFLNKCNAAWAAGEPSHRVKDMLDAADEFRKALNALSAPAVQPGVDLVVQVRMMLAFERIAQLIGQNWAGPGPAQAVIDQLCRQVVPIIEHLGMTDEGDGYGFDWLAEQEAVEKALGGRKAILAEMERRA
jgi:hypothetical protein